MNKSTTRPPKLEWPLRPGQRDLPPLPLAMRPETAAKALGISERSLWSLTQAGIIPHAKVGRIVMYPTGPILRWLEQIATKPILQAADEPEIGGDA
jgi:hypothetical protein